MKTLLGSGRFYFYGTSRKGEKGIFMVDDLAVVGTDVSGASTTAWRRLRCRPEDDFAEVSDRRFPELPFRMRGEFRLRTRMF